MSLVLLPWIRFTLVGSTIQQDNELNYCICIKLLLEFHLLFCSLEVINSLLWRAAERQPTVWLHSLLESGPVRGDIAPQGSVSKFVNDMHSGKRHTHTHTANIHILYCMPSKQFRYENLIITVQMCFIVSPFAYQLTTAQDKKNEILCLYFILWQHQLGILIIFFFPTCSCLVVSW